MVARGVLSVTCIFEGRINPHSRTNYLGPPPSCMAYAIAGTVRIDIEREHLGMETMIRICMLNFDEGKLSN